MKWFSKPLEVGQIWVGRNNNPFSESLTFRKVLEIRGDYVRYSFGHNIKEVGHYKSDSKCSTFKLGSKRYYGGGD